MENLLYLVGNSSEKFSSKKHKASFLTELPLIYREPGSGTRYTMEQYIEQNNLSIRNKMEINSNEAVKQAVIAGLGYSIMPLIGIRTELEFGRLQTIPIEGLPLTKTGDHNTTLHF